jgi:hypothetical protein
MAQEDRALCHIVVRDTSVEVAVFHPDGLPARPPALGEFKAADVLKELEALPLGDGAEVEAYGQRLFELLFADADVNAAFTQAEYLIPHDSKAVHVVVELEDKLSPGLLRLRWELLRDRVPRNLAVESPFRLVRRLGSEPTVDLRPWPIPPRVLVVISNPKNLESLQTVDGATFKPIEHPLSREQTKALLTLMEALQNDGKISGYQILGGGLDPPHPQGYPSLGRIRQALDDGRNAGEPHQILHFLAHGYLDGEGKGHLVLTDDGGMAKAEHQRAFRNLLPPGHQVRLIVFAACQSGEQAIGGALAGLAPSMLQRGVGVPAVIAMQDEVSVDAAAEFAAAFYRDLGDHGYIDTAMAHARAVVAIHHPDEWGIPVLYVQNETPRLFTPGVSADARQRTASLFAIKSEEHFVDRELELQQYTHLLYDRQEPGVCWLWGPFGVGKRTLLRQLRYEAFRRGYGHLMFENTYDEPIEGEDDKSKLYNLLMSMLQSQRLDQNDISRTCFSNLMEDRASGFPIGWIIREFLDGLERLTPSLEQGLVCLIYFRYFADNRDFVTGRAFRELINKAAERYVQGQLQQVRFMVAVEQPETRLDLYDDVFRGVHIYRYVIQEDLSGFQGKEWVGALCRSYGLARNGQVPDAVRVLVEASRQADGGYLPIRVVDWLARTHARQERGLEVTIDKWWDLNGSGGGR